jgi:hypothetical protein
MVVAEGDGTEGSGLVREGRCGVVTIGGPGVAAVVVAGLCALAKLVWLLEAAVEAEPDRDLP